MNVLIVGAGAVGQVYARHLKDGGARVAFLVKPRHEDEARGGFTLCHVRSKKRRETTRLVADEVLTSPEAVAKGAWDQVWLTIPTDALTDDFLDGLLPAIGDATVVVLTPGMDVPRIFGARVPAERVVLGLIGMLAWHAPLPGEPAEPVGTAYLFPPFSPSAFGGPRAPAVVKALRLGDCPAAVNHDIGVSQSFATGLMMPSIAALEAAGWSIAAMRRGPMIEHAARGAREAMAVVGAHLGRRPPFVRALIRAPIMSLVWWVAPWVLPVPLEAYIQRHFTKVGPQTRLLIADYAREAQEKGLPCASLSELSRSIAELPP